MGEVPLHTERASRLPKLLPDLTSREGSTFYSGNRVLSSPVHLKSTSIVSRVFPTSERFQYKHFIWWSRAVSRFDVDGFVKQTHHFRAAFASIDEVLCPVYLVP